MQIFKRKEKKKILMNRIKILYMYLYTLCRMTDGSINLRNKQTEILNYRVALIQNSHTI